MSRSKGQETHIDAQDPESADLQKSERLNELLLDSLPHPAMLINRERVILAANRIAREVGAQVGGYCWCDFGHLEYIHEQDRRYVQEHGGCAPPGGTKCTFCLADEALEANQAINNPEVEAFGQLWDTWWVPIEGGVYLHYAVNVTEQKRTQGRIEHLNAVLRAVRNINQLITRVRDRDQLLEGVCACLVETRGYQGAQITLLDNYGRLVATAEAGTVAQDSDQSKLSIQLAYGESVYGLLTVSIPRDLVIDDEEHALLEEVAGDIAFALHNIEQAEQRARAEQALKESLQTSADIVRAIPSGLFIYQYEPPDRLILLDSNPEAERLTGIRAEEWRGREFNEIWPQARQSGVTAAFLRPMHTGETFETEDQVYRDERIEGAYRIRAFPMPGQRLGVAFEDVTQRKQTEEALARERNLLRILIDSLPDNIYVKDTAGRFLLNNTTSMRLYGVQTQEEILGKTDADFMPPERVARYHAAEQAFLQAGEPVIDEEVFRPDRQSRQWVSDTRVPLRDAQGELIGFVNVGRDISERKRAQEALARRMEQLATLNRASQAVTASLELDQVLAEIVSLTGEVAGSDYASVMLVHDGEIRQGIGDLPGVPLMGSRVRDRGFTEWIIRTREPVLIDDVGEDGSVVPALPAGAPGTINPIVIEAGIRSVAGLPLVARDRLLGVLYLHSTRPSAFHGQIELLSTFANQAAIAIENARLHQETVRRLSEARAHSRVTAVLTRTLNLEQVLQSIVDAATDLVPASRSGVIHLIEEDSGRLIPRATSQNIATEAQLEMGIGEGIAGLAVAEKRTVNVPDIRDEDRFLIANGFYTPRSLLTAPLLIDEDCIGTLSINSDRAGAFDADDERLLATLAAQAAIAVRSARLHREVARRVEELTFLNRVGRTVVSSLDLGHILETVMEETSRILQTEASSVLLLDRGSGDLVFEAAVGPGAAAAKGLRLPVGEGIAGWVAQEAQPLLVSDVREDPRFSPIVDEATGFVTRSALAVPLRVKGEVIGVIEAINKTQGALVEADLVLLSSMAQSAAVAIDNARLYADLQARMAELERTQNQLVQSAKLAAVGELAAGVAHEVNNPLTSILGFTSLILDDMRDTDPLRADLEIIEQEAYRCKSIVRGLLDFARQTAPQIVPADVGEVLQSTVALVRHQAMKARVTIKETYGMLPLVPLDEDQIKQVFLNLMTNGIQAMPEGGELRIVTRLRGGATTDGGGKRRHVAIEFHDTGVGIPEENLYRIFDPFYTTKETGEGTGLGLSISQSIVEKHGGRIEVESQQGRGSIFSVLLPLTEG